MTENTPPNVRVIDQSDVFCFDPSWDRPGATLEQSHLLQSTLHLNRRFLRVRAAHPTGITFRDSTLAIDTTIGRHLSGVND